jgi:hypothetical protein
MHVAALYDIHGNLPALEAVLREVREAEVDVVVVGAMSFLARCRERPYNASSLSTFPHTSSPATVNSQFLRRSGSTIRTA